MRIETPWNFREIAEYSNWKIEYHNVTEACQGGPIVGDLWINGVQIQAGMLFGGPYIVQGDELYVPFFERKLFSTGFRIFCWNLESKVFKIGSKKYPLIWLDKIEDDQLFFAVGNSNSEKIKVRIGDIIN